MIWKDASTAHLTAIYGAGKSLWAVGYGSTILCAADGTSWKVQHRDGETAGNMLNAVFSAADGKSAWAVGNEGIILHTSDGENWLPQRGGDEEMLLGVFGTPNGKSVWAVGADGTILHTGDGEHWTIQYEGSDEYLHAVFGSADGKSVWALDIGGGILHTTDGEHWAQEVNTTLTTLFSDRIKGGFESADGKSVWLVGGSGTILHSDNDGGTWSVQQSGTTETLSQIFGAGDGKSLWAVGSKGTIVHTSDGEHWTAQKSGTSDDLSRVFVSADGKHAWAVADTGVILSFDGNGWANESAAFGGPLYSLFTAGLGKSAWAVGEDGAIVNTSDGEHWFSRKTGTPAILGSVFGTADGKSAWAVGRDGIEGAIVHTNDEGKHWSVQRIDTALFRVFGTADGESVWVVGDKGTILHTSDGEHWSAQQSGTRNALLSFFGTGDGKSLWVTGAKGTILHTSDGEHWSPQQSGTVDALTSIFGTRDGKSVWVAGENGAILHTSDGEHWSAQQSGTWNSLASIFGTADGKTLWAVGEKGIIVHSGDGEHWSAQESGTRLTLVSISGSADGKSVFAVGERGTILHTTDGEHWFHRNSDARFLMAVHVAADGQSALAAGSRGLTIGSMTVEREAFIEAGRLWKTLDGTQLELRVTCPGKVPKAAKIDVTASNQYKFDHKISGTDLAEPVWHPESCRFDPIRFKPADVELLPGDRGYFQIDFYTGTSSGKYTFSAIYDPWYWIRQNWRWLTPIIGICLLLSLFFSLLYLNPLWNLKLYRFSRLSQFEQITAGIPSIGPGLELAIKTITILPWFVHHSRTLDAWVREKRELILANLESSTSTIASYIPLPIRLTNVENGLLIQEPTPGKIETLFSPLRNVLQIVGPGGSGKTTFARQVCVWAISAGQLGGFSRRLMLPIWVDEDLDSKENPLPKIVHNKLQTVISEEDIDQRFVNALLRKQRILVVLDRLSERSPATQTYVANIYRTTRTEALLITTRRPTLVEGASSILIYPQPLDSSNLLRFVTTLLREENESPSESNSLSSIQGQLALGHRIAQLFDLTKETVGRDGVILPLPVRLFVEEAKRLIKLGLSLENLPLSIPEVYFRYLEQINPKSSELLNVMSDEAMLRAAKILGTLAVAGDFIPKEFLKIQARAALRDGGWNSEYNGDPIERLKDNGVLLEKRVLGEYRLRFTLDPIAEFLAAAAYGESCGTVAACWDELIAKCDTAPGFQAAIKLVRSVRIAQPNSRMNSR